MVLLHHVPHLNTKHVVSAVFSPHFSSALARSLARLQVLASASPRRSELLKTLGLSFTVRASTFDESLDKASFTSASAYATATALHKALEVAQQRDAHLVIGADTVVDLDGEVLEKPADEQEAMRMIGRLSGTRHAVHTGVAFVFPCARDPVTHARPRVVTFSETTRVTFSKLHPAAIASYVASGDCYGKAGAYGIQGAAGSFVSGIEGCYHNVVGLPLHRLSAELLALIDAGVLDEEEKGREEEEIGR